MSFSFDSTNLLRRFGLDTKTLTRLLLHNLSVSCAQIFIFHLGFIKAEKLQHWQRNRWLRGRALRILLSNCEMEENTFPMNLPSALLEQLTARRGRAYAFAQLPVSKTALVAIDLTTLFFGTTPEENAIATRINQLAQELRRRGGVVMWIRPAPFAHPDLMQQLLGPKLAALHSQAHHSGDARNQLAPSLDVQPEDLQTRKALFSAFFPGSSDAEAQLKARGIEYVLIAGVVTDVCVEASARDAFSCGFRTILLSDATKGSSDEAHANTLANFHRLFGDVRSVEEAISVLC